MLGVTPVLGQSEVPPPETPALINQVGAWFVYLVMISGAVYSSLEILKPVVLDQLEERFANQHNIYIGLVYTLRLVLAGIGLALFDGLEPVLAEAPFLATFPTVGVMVVSALLISVGSDFLHILLEILTRFKPDQIATVRAVEGGLSVYEDTILKAELERRGYEVRQTVFG